MTARMTSPYRNGNRNWTQAFAGVTEKGSDYGSRRGDGTRKASVFAEVTDSEIEGV